MLLSPPDTRNVTCAFTAKCCEISRCSRGRPLGSSSRASEPVNVWCFYHMVLVKLTVDCRHKNDESVCRATDPPESWTVLFIFCRRVTPVKVNLSYTCPRGLQARLFLSLSKPCSRSPAKQQDIKCFLSRHVYCSRAPAVHNELFKYGHVHICVRGRDLCEMSKRW